MEEHNDYSREFIDKLVKATVRETLAELGLDTNEPFEHQRDVAFLRNLRRASQGLGAKVLGAAVFTIWSGLIGLIIIGLRDWFGRSG